MESNYSYKKKVLIFCKALSMSILKVKEHLFQIVKRLIKIGKKDIKKNKKGGKISPFKITKQT